MFFIISIIYLINLLNDSKNSNLKDSYHKSIINRYKTFETSLFKNLVIIHLHLNKRITISMNHIVLSSYSIKCLHQIIKKNIYRKIHKLLFNNTRIINIFWMNRQISKYIKTNQRDFESNIKKKYFVGDKNVNLIKEKDKMVIKKLDSKR